MRGYKRIGDNMIKILLHILFWIFVKLNIVTFLYHHSTKCNKGINKICKWFNIELDKTIN